MPSSTCSTPGTARAASQPSSARSALLVELVLVLVEVLVFVEFLGGQAHAAVAALVGRLEVLEQLVKVESAVLSHRRDQPIPATSRKSSPQIAQLALDLRLHVERLLALPSAALVARHDQLANLLAERRIDRGRG